MVSKLKNLFSKTSQGIHEAALLIAALSLCSQLLGLVRDKLLAHHFGAGSELDIYWAAFRVPDFLYTTLSSILAAIVVLPLLIERLQESEEKARKFVNSIFTAFLVVGISMSALLYLAMPYLAHLVVPGMTGERVQEFIHLARILLLSPIILGISNLLGSITQAYKKFFAFAVAPVLYNLGIIIGVVFFLPYYGLQGIVFGVIIGSCLHMLVQIPVAISHSLTPRPTITPDWKSVAHVASLSLPRVLTLGFTQISITGYVAMASLFASGSIAIFTLAYNLQSVWVTLIGVSYSVAAFPILSEHFVAKNMEAFQGYVLSALRHVIFWSLPVLCASVIFRAHLVRILFGSGAFDWTDTRLTAAVFALFAISLLSQNVTLLLLRAAYAAKQTVSPLVTQALAMIGGLIVLKLSLPLLKSVPYVVFFLESLFRVTDISGTSVLILPAFFTLSATIGTALLWFDLYRKNIVSSLHPVRKVFFESFSASLLAAYASYQFLAFSGTVLPIQTFWGIVLQTTIGGLIGIVVWLFVLLMLKSKELHEFLNSLRHRFWKVQTIAPEQSDL